MTHVHQTIKAQYEQDHVITKYYSLRRNNRCHTFFLLFFYSNKCHISFFEKNYLTLI